METKSKKQQKSINVYENRNEPIDVSEIRKIQRSILKYELFNNNFIEFKFADRDIICMKLSLNNDNHNFYIPKRDLTQFIYSRND